MSLRRPACRARDNPFAVHRVLRVRYAFDAAAWDRLLARLADMGGCGAIVGPHGSGKTTLLEDLAGRLQARGQTVCWIRLNREVRAIPPAFWRAARPGLGSADALFIDGAEQLTWLGWLRLRFLARRAGACVITTHRPGRLPTLWTCTTSPAVLCGVAERLGVSLGPDLATKVFQRQGGNIREALRELYDHWSRAGTARTTSAEAEA